MTITLDPRPLAPPPLDLGGVELPEWTTPRRPSLARRALRRLLGIREIGILTLLSLALDITAGCWMWFHQHFFINDELNRISDAIYVTVGRDPHLGAIGFYWPPLPQLLNCLFVPIVEPFGYTIMAGPLETAFCMAFTIPVLAKLGKSLGVGRWTTFTICLVFALNPVAIYNSTNGMSEACFFLTGALTMLGFLRYVRSRSTSDMMLFGGAMCALIMTRLEGPFIVVVLVVVASFEWRNLRSWRSLRQSTWTAVLLAAPPVGTFAFWMLVQWILLKNPFFFLDQGGAGPPGDASWLPNQQDYPWSAYPWALHWVLVLGMVLAVALAGIILAPRSNRTRGSLGIVGATATILTIQIYLVGYKHGYGDPRYFSMAVPFTTVAALWLAARSSEVRRPGHAPGWQPWWSTVWNLGLIAILVVNAATGSWTMSDGSITAIERECTFFQGDVAQLLPFLGRGGKPGTSAYCNPIGNPLVAFQRIDTLLDKRLKTSDRVLTDNSTIFAADLFTTHPNQFIVRNDRDWEKTVANPAGKFTYIITASNSRKGLPDSGNPLATTATQGNMDYGADIINGRPAAWKLVASSPEGAPASASTWVQLYEVTGTVAPAAINGPTGQIASQGGG